ncbi:Spy0128 family protein [Bifidobacterium vansinderenii]|uniref:Cell surface protein n=1 Tax=Bifidobacterium vansinderenii TaxID=1984871 RepID=A0A229VXF0_9BIFI|nr:Cna B-type domain-containing protein [Bifidobacterium vansinderenii]OXN00301.1 cell surface protein [Bifidobacterium vansinderenii]
MTRMKKNEKPGRVGGIGARLVAVASAAAMFLAVAVSGTAIAATTESPSPTTTQTQAAQSDQKTSDANSTSTPDATKSSTPTQTETSKSGKSTTDSATSDSKVVSKDKQAAATPAPAAVAAAPQARSISGITAEAWTSNQHHEDSDVYLSGGTEGLNRVNGMAVQDLAYTKNGYTFWKASLKGSDGYQDYGDKQDTTAGNNQSNTGATVTRIRYQSESLQFLINGNWVTPNNSYDSDLQLVFYYLQDQQVGDYATFHMSDWFVGDFNASDYSTGSNSLWTSKAVIAEVVDADTNQQLAKSDTMYYYNTHAGVNNITASEQNLGEYEILYVAKYKASNQNSQRSWTSTNKSGDPLETYTVNDMKTGMETHWNKNASSPNSSSDPYHVIFTIYVHKTAQVSLVKHLDGNDTSEYQNQNFTFSAKVTLPEGSKSTLRTSYPAQGLAVGSSVSMVVDADGKTGTITGIQAKPDQPVTIKGLPNGAKVVFTETGTPGNDPSVFTTAYVNDKTNKIDGSATAYPAKGTGNEAPQTVTTTNTVSSGEGKMTVTKTFHVKNLTWQERSDLADAFQITSTDNKIPALTTRNASTVTEGGLTADDADTVTYTWNMSRLETGKVTLTEQNYQAGSKNVTTSATSATNGSAFKPSVDATITKDTQSVTFVNEYGTTPIDVKITKQWSAEIANDQKKPVKVKLNWKGTEKNASGTQGEYTLNADGKWTTTIKNLPNHTADYGDITYSVEETSVDGKTPTEAGFKVDVTGDQTKGFTVTNSPASIKLAANDFVQVKKKLAGRTWNDLPADGSFQFELKASDSAPLPKDAKGKDVSSIAISAADKDSDNLSKAKTFGDITYTSIGTYTYTLTEKQQGKIPGFSYSDAVFTVTVKVDSLTANGVVVTVAKTSGSNGEVSEDNVAIFTNAYVAVSQLPLTGGTTGRAWLVAGGVLLAMAGASYAVWRKRQMA